MTGIVRTVTGDRPANSLGHTQPHEHILADLRQPLPADVTAAERDWQERRITLENYYETRREHRRADLLLDDENVAIEELRRYRDRGGETIVDLTSHGLGRRPDALVRIAGATGVNIVMGSSVYYRDYHPAHIAHSSFADIAAEVVCDIETGIGETGIRAGIIGEVGLSWPHHADELTVLRGSAIAQTSTGAALNIHPARHPDSPAAAVSEAEAYGAEVGKVIVSHLDRTIFHTDKLYELADSGCLLEFDLFGQESSYYSLGAIDMPNDAARIDLITRLIERGHLNQILVSQDICHKTSLRRYGGEGYTHILDHVIPMMRRKGITDEQVHTITVDTPARVLTISQDAMQKTS